MSTHARFSLWLLLLFIIVIVVALQHQPQAVFTASYPLLPAKLQTMKQMPVSVHIMPWSFPVRMRDSGVVWHGVG